MQRNQGVRQMAERRRSSLVYCVNESGQFYLLKLRFLAVDSTPEEDILMKIHETKPPNAFIPANVSPTFARPAAQT